MVPATGYPGDCKTMKLYRGRVHYELGIWCLAKLATGIVTPAKNVFGASLWLKFLLLILHRNASKV